MELSAFTVQVGASLSDALKKLEYNCRGCVLVLSDTKLTGVITDGDIRRSLLSGASLQTCVADIMNVDFFSFTGPVSSTELSDQFNTAIKFIPVVSTDGELQSIEFPNEVVSIPIASPKIGHSEKKYVNDCLDTSWISSRGSYVDLFELKFSELHNGSSSLSVCNGTVALHLALLALEIGPGDEVIVPNLTFAATVNAVLYCGATPVLVDVDPTDWCMNSNDAEDAITSKTKAIVTVNLYGQVTNLDDFSQLSKKYDIKWVQDCAESIGSTYKDNHAGTYGDASTFSFFGNKTITTGEGGMIVFKSQLSYEKAKVLRDHGMSRSKRYWHEVIGYNYRLTNLQAAIGVGQLEKLPQIVKNKRDVASLYGKQLTNSDFIELLPYDKLLSQNSFWVYAVKLRQDIDIERVVQFLDTHGIESRRAFYPINRMPAYKDLKCVSSSVSDDIFASCLCLPAFPEMSTSEVERVANKLIDACLTQNKQYEKNDLPLRNGTLL